MYLRIYFTFNRNSSINNLIDTTHTLPSNARTDKKGYTNFKRQFLLHFVLFFEDMMSKVFGGVARVS